jgi:hypothetical protein
MKLAQSAALRPPTATGHEISRVRGYRSMLLLTVNKGFFNRLERY